MKIYRVKLQPVSSYISPLQSDTIFGAFCWAYKYTYGEEKLEEFLEKYVKGTPPIIFSNIFPEDILPFPLINLPWRMDDHLSKQQKFDRYRKYKIIKKMDFISLESFNAVINGSIKISRVGKQHREVVNYGNLINRITGTVMDSDDSGGLFARKETYHKGKLVLYAKVIDGWEDIFVQLIEVVCAMGIGGDKSIGKGIFEVENIQQFNGFKIPSNPNAFVTLSNYIPSEDDPVEGNYKTRVKYGKLDREYARTDKPFKKPLLMITEGAVFYTEIVKDFYGRVVRNVSNYNNKIIHSGIAFVVPMSLKK